MSAQPVENVQVRLGPVPRYPMPAPSGRDLTQAVHTRRRRKCIAAGEHAIAGKCERCGL